MIIVVFLPFCGVECYNVLSYHWKSSNLSSDATYARLVDVSVPQLIEIHRDLLEDYSGVWTAFRVELCGWRYLGLS
jgi:hypothetical protein